MNTTTHSGIFAALSLALLSVPASPQTLHLDDRWENCSIVLDETLTQDSWRQFVSEAGLVTYFRPLTSAQPLGPGRFELGLLRWSTAIDDRDPAWNDTFVHPDAAHWLFDGSTLPIPGLALRAGVTRRIDVGAYWTTSPGANYSVIGGQLQYNLLNDLESGLAASGRATAVRLFGPQDVGLGAYGIDFVVSKQVSRFSPYAGVGTYLARGRETTSKVALDDESVLGLQAVVGTEVRLWFVRLGGEANLARVPGYSFKVALAR